MTPDRRLSDSPTDAELLTAYSGGDLGAFRILAERHQAGLLRYAMVLLRDRSAAEDAVQEALLTLARTPPDHGAPIDPLVGADGAPRGIGAWLHKVTRNQCLDMIRSESRRRAREGDRELGRPTAVLDPSLDAVDATDTKALITRVLGTLPDDQREAVTLRLLQEKTYAEIAEITGRKVGTVAWQISCGMKALARELSPLLEA